MLTSAEQQAVRNEINNDPKSLGYSAYVENATGTTATIHGDNWQRGIQILFDSEVPGDEIDGDPISPQTLKSSIMVEYPYPKETYDTIEFRFNGEYIDIAGEAEQALLLSMFDENLKPLTRANVLAAKRRQAKRIEIILGRSRSISMDDIAIAVRGG